MMAIEKRTGKSAKMGILPMRGRLTCTLRRYCEKRMRQMMVGMPICTHEPTPFSVSPQPAHITPREHSACDYELVDQYNQNMRKQAAMHDH